MPILKELIRVVKPEGSIFILGWTSQMMLPGYPILEARLNSTTSGIAPFVKDKNPGSHFLRTMNLFQKAGIVGIEVDTFIGDIHSPLTKEVKKALLSLLQMRWTAFESELSRNDWILYQKLCQPESPDYIFDIPDYYAFFTYSMFHGRKSRII